MAASKQKKFNTFNNIDLKKKCVQFQVLVIIPIICGQITKALDCSLKALLFMKPIMISNLCF